MADVDPLVDELAALICDQDQGCHDCVSGAGRVLKHLANAGRLLPEGGETEWGYGWSAASVAATYSEAVARRAAAIRKPPATVYHRYVGPWVDVDPEVGDG